ncbi:hypothetical protein LSM04_004247 [Trypanosoma melophagium]|uniref:uncharacterized protein n=1 Tax=Trypanosoma melophagium TaxID=715481 RepID=UPI00351A7F19|nr:hypothetical protein LSM04_004247 [Trypanosoma melophagium]
MGSEWSSVSTKHDVPPLDQKEAVLLANETHYRTEELQQLYSLMFLPIRVLSFQFFCAAATFLGVKSPILQEMLFSTFDQNRDGIIAFDEFAIVLSIMSLGTPHEKIELVFNMLHSVNNYPRPMPSNSSTLQRKGVCAVVEGLKETFGSRTSLEGQQKQQEELSMFCSLNVVEELFGSSMEVTHKEFVVYVTRSPTVLRGLAIS